ncbi:hypothetical protein [Agrobacterium sp.]|uniref:hypothetical protein n=1 Tax=Agrobacterium sp. TaxID=361 RepID=UPI002898E80F|nr:hypothetical protein [Agrobacterium sp.]
MYRKALANGEKIFAVAPMIDWTDYAAFQGEKWACCTSRRTGPSDSLGKLKTKSDIFYKCVKQFIATADE